ncbi:MAG: Hsp20 family protein [Alphaproteobacteria bacterium]
MRTFDLSPLYRSTVGFDRIFDLLDSMGRPENVPSYPPYNVERLGENAYRVTMAVAGFSDDDLMIEVRDNTLLIKGEKQTSEESGEKELLYRGIAGRNFERRFELADHVKVRSAVLENGLLSIELEREVPEELKPRRIEIQSADAGRKSRVIDNQPGEGVKAA